MPYETDYDSTSAAFGVGCLFFNGDDGREAGMRQQQVLKR